MADANELAPLPEKKERERESPYAAYVRQCSDELAFIGHADANGWICGIGDSSEPPTRADLIAGWLSVPIVEVRTVNGQTVRSPDFHLTRSQAEAKVDAPVLPRHERPVPMALLWDGWPSTERVEEAA